jgi:predicted cupin superfamily sugar epimerase
MSFHVDLRVAELIEKLELLPHPEGGYYREVFRSAADVTPKGARDSRSALTTIYFLLAAGQHSRWHQLRSDEVWHFYEGHPLEQLTADAELQRIEVRTLGAEDPYASVYVVPATYWQAARTTGAYSLVGCTVGPGFDFADFRLLADVPEQAARLAERFPEVASLV